MPRRPSLTFQVLRQNRLWISRFLAVFMALWQIGQPLQAATYVWDSDVGTTGAQDGLGIWTAGGTVFWDSVSGTNVATANSLITDIAQFGAGGVGGLVDVRTQSINGLIFDTTTTSGYTLNTTGITQLLTIGSGGIVLNSGALATTIGSGALGIVTSGSQTWTNNSTLGGLTLLGTTNIGTGNTLTLDGAGNFTFSGVSGTTNSSTTSNTGAITKNGTGTVTFTTDPNNTGALTINGGTVNFAQSSGNADFTVATVNTGGTLLSTSTNALSDNLVLTMAGGTYDLRNSDSIGALSGTGVVISGGGTPTLTVSTTTNQSFAGTLQNGAGTLSFGKSNTNTVTLTGANTAAFGTVTVNTAVLAVNGALGSIAGATAINVGDFNNAVALPADTLTLGATTDVVAGTLNRLPDTGTLALRGFAALNVNGPAATSGGFIETIGTLNLNNGSSTITLAPASGQEIQVSGAALTQTAGATALLRGTGLGLAAGTADSSRLIMTTAPTLLGAAGADGSTTVSILPWLIGDNSITGAGADFVTYNATNGFRTLTGSEYDTAIAGTALNRNVRTAGGETLSVDSAVNGLKITGGTTTLSGANTALVVNGAVLATGAATIAGPSRLDFGSAGQSLVTVASNTAATLAIDAPISGTNGLIINSTGTAQNIVQLGGENSVIGTLRVHPNTILQLKPSSSGALNDNVMNNLALDTGSVLRLNGNSVAIGNLTTNAAARNGVIENASATNATLTTYTTAAQTFEGLFQNGTGAGTLSLVKSGTGALTIQNTSSSMTGSVEVRGGNITLTSNGAGLFSAVSSVILTSGGTMTLGHGTNNSANRISNTASLQMRGGTLTQNGSGTNNQTEAIGPMQIQAGLNTIVSGQAGAANTENLTFSTWSRSPGAVVNFSGTGVGADSRNRVIITAAPTLNDSVLIGATVVNELAKYVADADTVTAGNQPSVAPFATADYLTTAASGWTATTNAKPAALQTLAADTSVNAVVLNAIGLNLGSKRLNVDSGMIITTGASNISNGTLTAGNAGAGELIIKVDTGTTQDFATNNVLIDNNGANPVALTLYGAGTALLKAGSTYSGATAINGVTTTITADSALGVAPASPTAGHLKLYGTTLNVPNTMTLDANRGIELGGATNVISMTAGTAGNGRTLTYNGGITSNGESSITFQSNATNTNVDPGKFVGTLTALNVGGNFRLEAGTVTAPSAANVVGRNFQVAVNGTASYTQAGGSLKIGAGVVGDSFDVGVSGADTINKAGTLNLSGTTQLTANVDIVRFGVVSGGSASTAQGTVTLATNNDITALTSLILGNSGGAGLSTQILNFGAGTNNVTTPLMVLGGQKVPQANISLPTGGTLAIQGFRERQTDLIIARQNVSTGTLGLATMDVTGTLTANLNSLQIGLKSAGSIGGADAVLNLSANSHNIETNTLLLGDMAGESGAVTAISRAVGTINMAGGTLNVLGNATLGNYSGTLGTARGLLNITGGTVVIGGDIVKADNDRSSSIITVDGATLDLQDQARGDTSPGTLTASQFNLRSGSLIDAGAITLDGRGVTDGITFAPLDNALVIRDFTLSNAISFTNATTNKGGILYEAAGAGTGSTLSGSVNLGTVQRTINVEDNAGVANDLILSGALTTLGGIIKSGAGTLLLSNSSSTYSGSTAVQNGKLTLAGTVNDRLGTTGTMTLGNSTTSGILQLGDASGASNQTFSALSTSGTGTANAVLGGNATVSTLTVNQNTNTTFAGNLGGSGTNEDSLNLVKQGAGQLTLGGSSTYTGTTDVQAGALRIDSAAGFPTISPSLNVGNTAEFLLYGTSPSANVVKSFSGAGTVLTVGGATGGTLGFGIDGLFNSQLALAAGQNMSLNGTLTTKIQVNNAPTAGQDYILINGTDAGSLGATGTFNINPTVFNGGSFTYALRRETNGGTNDQWILTPTAQPAAADVWWKGDLTGLGLGVWSATTTSGTGFPSNFDLDQTSGTDALVPPDSGSVVHFSANGAANFATTLGANLTIKKLIFETGSITNGVTVGGTHSLTLGKSTVLGSGGLEVAAGNGAGTLTISAPIALGVAQSWNVNDATSNLTLSGGISGTGPLAINNNGSAVGTVTLTGVTGISTYTGDTSLEGGRLILNGGVNDRLPSTGGLTLGGVASNASLQLGDATNGASSQTLTSLASGASAANAIVGGGAVFSVLTINQASTSTFNGNIGGAGTNENSLSLVKSGIGSLTMNGNASYTGPTTVNAGTLIFNGANTSTGAITINGGLLQLGASGSLTGATGLALNAPAGGSAVFDVNGRAASINSTTITLGGADSAALSNIIDTVGTGTLTLSAASTTITYNATNNPLGSTISVDLIGTGGARTIVGNDSSAAATDLTVSGDYLTTTNNSFTLDGTGNNLFSGNITSDSLAETSRDLTKSGTGTWTVSGSVNIGDSIGVNAGTYNITGTSRQNDLVTSNVGTVTNISGLVDGSLVADTANNGIYSRSGAVTNILADNLVGPNMEFILLSDNGAGTSTFNLNTFNVAIPRLDVGGASNAADRIGLVTGTGTITIGTVVNAYAGTVSANLASVSTGQVINKDSVGTIVLNAVNTLGTSASLIREGGLTLDFTTNAGTDNKIGTGALTLGATVGEASPVLTLIGHSSAASSQTVASIALARGASDITLDGNGGTLSLNVTGAITRANAATVNFNIEAGTQVGAGTTTLIDGILGGWATVNDRKFATITSGNIAALSTVSGNDPETWVAGQHVSNTANFTGIVDCAKDIASLTLEAASASTLNIASIRTLTISSGGILNSPDVGANNNVITGGLLSSTQTNNALIVHQNNTAGTLEIASRRVGGDLVKSGGGILILSGSSLSNTGTVTINEGTLRVTGGNAIGDSADVVVQGSNGTAQSNFELAAGQTESIRQLLGGENSNGLVTLNTGATLTINQTDGDGTADENLVFGGNITGAGTLVKNGNDRLNLTGVSSHTGTLIINNNAVILSGALGRIASPSIIVNGPGQLISSQDQAAAVDRLLNTVAVTLNNTNTGTTNINQGFYHLTNQGATRTETIGSFTVGAGHNTITTNGGVASAVADLSGTGLTRNGRATLMVRGNALGASSGQRGQIRFSTAPTGSVGGAGAAGTTTISILPWIIGDLSTTGLGNTLVTNTGATNGLRPLATTEYVADAAGFDGLTAATLSTANTRFTASATLAGTASGVNSLVIDSATAVALTGPANSLELTSGVILAAGAGAHSIGGWSAITTSGTRDYTAYVTDPAGNASIASPLTSAVPFVKSGAGTLTLTNASNAFTNLHLNQGIVVADALAKLGSGNITFNGGAVRLAAGFPGATEDLSSKAWDVGTGGGTIDVSLVTSGITFANGLKDTSGGTADTLTLITRSATAGTTGMLTIQGSSTFAGTVIVPQSVNNNIVSNVVLNGTTNAAINGNLQIGNVTSGTLDVVVGLGADEQIVDTATISFVSASGAEAYFKLLGRTETVAGISAASRGVIENHESAADTVAANGKLIVNSSQDFSYTGFLRDRSTGTGGTLAFEKLGTGTQTLVGTNVIYTGPTTIASGTLRLLGTTSFNSNITNNATLELNQTTATWTLTKTISGSGSVVKTGAGTVTLSGVNSYSGVTEVQQGVMSISSSDNLGDASASNTIRITNNATLQSTGADVDLGANRSIAIAGLTGATIDVTGTNKLTLSGLISGDDCHLLTKIGTGSLFLTGANAYAGATNVSDGTLQVGVAGVGATGTGLITAVKTAATYVNAPIISGSGTLQGAVVIGDTATAANRGILTPGDGNTNSSNATLTITSAVGLTIAAGSQTQLGITAASGTDAAFVASGMTASAYLLSLGSASDASLTTPAAWANQPTAGQGDFIKLNGGTGALVLGTNGGGAAAGQGIVSIFSNGLNTGTLAAGQIFNLVDWFGAFSGGFSAGVGTSAGGIHGDFDLPDLSTTGFRWDTSAFTSHGVIAVVPEPSRALLMLIGLLALGFRRRRIQG